MSLLIRAAEVVGRPVVTLAGDDVAEVKDIVFSRSELGVIGFTLNGRGFLSGPLRESLPWGQVHALGPDAVMIVDEQALRSDAELADEREPGSGDVIGVRVITDGGTDLGRVLDVVIDVEESAEVVGYELVGSEAVERGKGRRLFIPTPDTLAISDEALIVPAGVLDYVQDDFAGLGAAVERFRARHKKAS